jgi:insertion element IS1 protein InsB
MDCKYCTRPCRRSGKQNNGSQRYYCPTCRKYQQKTYQYKAYHGAIDSNIKLLVCESVCVRGIGRILNISTNTVLSRIRKIAGGIAKPAPTEGQTIFEVDEIWTYIAQKDNEYWLAYGINKTTGKVMDFVIGKRTKGTLKILIDSLLKSSPKNIRTDNLTTYQRLIPKGIHQYGAYCINQIERNNLSIRTHIKRLSRRTICFSRSIVLLESCIKIYFWG